MLRRLSRVRARVEKLSGAFNREGCAVCWEDEARTRIRWSDVRADPPISITEELAAHPQSETCSACGRTYVLTYHVVSWMT